MNVLTQIKNQQKVAAGELARGVADSASWHSQFKHSAYIFTGGLPYDLTEGDLLAIFAQYGEIVDVNLVRDRDTGKSRGFAYLAYEDQRSTVVAVDNLNGARVLGRTLKVDHVKDYRIKKEEDEEQQQRHGSKEEREGAQAAAGQVRLDAASGRAAAPKEARAGGGASTLQPWESTGSLFAMLTSAEAAPAPQRHRAGAAGFFEDHKSEKSGKLSKEDKKAKKDVKREKKEKKKAKKELKKAKKQAKRDLATKASETAPPGDVSGAPPEAPKDQKQKSLLVVDGLGSDSSGEDDLSSESDSEGEREGCAEGADVASKGGHKQVDNEVPKEVAKRKEQARAESPEGKRHQRDADRSRSLAGFQSMRDTGGRRDALRDEERNHARRDQDSRGRDRGDGERGRYRSRSRSRDRDFERRPHDRRPQHGHGRDRIDTKDAYDRSR